jgi:hypothetical protein
MITICLDKSYWYLGSVYRRYPDGLDAAADTIERIAAKFVDASVSVYVPVAHTHHVAKHTTLPPDSSVWVDLNLPFMHPAKGMIVVRMANWEVSSGIAAERKFFRQRGRPIVDVTEGDPVGDFFKVFPSEARSL